MSNDLNDDGYMLLAIADDFAAQMDDGEPVDPDDVYDWLVAKAHEIGKPKCTECGGIVSPSDAASARCHICAAGSASEGDTQDVIDAHRAHARASSLAAREREGR